MMEGTTITDDVYVDLFSNSSLDLYSSNRVSSFTVKLDQPIQLQGGNYECALAQMISPTASEISINGQVIIISTPPDSKLQKDLGVKKKSILPYKDHTVFFNSYIADPTSTISTPTPPKYKPSFPTGLQLGQYSFIHQVPENQSSFKNAYEVVSYINDLFYGTVPSPNPAVNEIIKQRTYDDSSSSMKHVASFSTTKNRFLKVVLRDSDFQIALSAGLGRIMGFDDLTDDQWLIFQKQGIYEFNSSSSSSTSITSRSNEIDNNEGRQTLLSVYTNVILPHRVGDTSAPLIRTCTLDYKKGKGKKFHNFEFDSLHYLPVAHKYIQEIQIDVRGNDGRLIPFQGGILYVRLHFRPRRQA